MTSTPTKALIISMCLFLSGNPISASAILYDTESESLHADGLIWPAFYETCLVYGREPTLSLLERFLAEMNCEDISHSIDSDTIIVTRPSDLGFVCRLDSSILQVRSADYVIYEFPVPIQRELPSRPALTEFESRAVMFASAYNYFSGESLTSLLLNYRTSFDQSDIYAFANRDVSVDSLNTNMTELLGKNAFPAIRDYLTWSIPNQK